MWLVEERKEGLPEELCAFAVPHRSERKSPNPSFPGAEIGMIVNLRGVDQGGGGGDGLRRCLERSSDLVRVSEAFPTKRL